MVKLRILAWAKKGKETRPWRGLKSMENYWKTLVFACPAHPARERTWAKKKGDTVIANPYKTLIKQAFPAGRHSRARVAGRRHGHGAASNQWKPIGKPWYLHVPRTLPANARGQKKGDTVIAKPYKTLRKQAFPENHRKRIVTANRPPCYMVAWIPRIAVSP